MSDFNLLNHIRNADEQSTVIWLFNIGVEKYWNPSAHGVKDAKEDIIVNHIEEITLLITRKQDIMILRKMPSESFLASLEEKGYEIPNIFVPACEDEMKSISQLVLEDKAILEQLTKTAQQENVFFVPYGISELEEQIAKTCGLQLIGGTTEKSKRVNNKIFSKEVAKKLNFPAADENICHSIEEIRMAYDKLTKSYQKIIIKMPCNSSGQGMWVVESEKKLNTVSMIIKRMMRNQKNMEWLVEGWIEKERDLNLQVYVSESGYIETFSIKEQVIDGTLYIGSIVPARISQQQYRQCIEYGDRIGAYLYSLGYTGIFGIDALVDKDGEVIPIIEINGRFTLSTYLSFVCANYPGKTMYAFYKRFVANEHLNYQQLVTKLNEENLWLTDSEGLYIYNASTVDATLASGHVRAFCMAIGDDFSVTESLNDKFSLLCDEYKE